MPDTTAVTTTLAACPGCGVDVRGCTETVGGDGRRRWMQPTSRADRDRIEGGLVHIENGPRCTADQASRGGMAHG